MKYYTPFYSPFLIPALAASLFLAVTPLQAQDTSTNATERTPATATLEVSPELMRSFLYLQEQVHATQLAIERSRLEAEVADARKTEALNARLEVIEDALAQANVNSTSMVREVSQQMRESNRNMMLLAGVFAAFGFLALALTTWLQWKTTSQLRAAPTEAAFPALLPPQGYGALGFGQAGGRTPNTQLKDALGRLEHRIADLEVEHHESAHSAGTTAKDSPDDDTTNRTELASLIKEGEKLLADEQAEKAIEHFDAILAKHPGHPEVLLHKGAALERLQRDQEAIECYDQAIRADKNLTMAYLHKGGLYNRMEKFNEAMECYEQALKVQEKRATVS